MSVDIVECGAEEKTKPRVPRGNDSRGLPGLPSDLTVLQTAPAHTFSSLEVSQQDVDQAAGAGRVKMLEWMWEESNGALYPSSTGLQMAAAAGKIVTLEWAQSRGLHGFEGLMDVAAWRGGLSVLKWLLANRVEGCTINAVNWAARSGKLKVLRWLRDNLGFHECASEGLEAAATAGHARVVAWLLRNGRQDPAITPAVVGAASSGHANILKLLLSAPQQKEKSGWAMALAVRGGHSECVRLLQAADWPTRLPVAGDEDGRRGMPPAEGGPGNDEEGAQMLLKGLGRAGDSVARETANSDGTTKGRRCPSSPSEGVGTASTTPASSPAEIRSDDGQNDRHTRAAAPPPSSACAHQQYLPPATSAVENVSLWRRHSVAASKPPSARLRLSTRRVLSMDMALPGLRPEGTTPSYLRELLEEPVLLQTPRRWRFPPPAAGGKQLCCDRSTSSRSSAAGSPNAKPARGPRQKEGVTTAAVESPEGLRLEKLQWFSEGASGIDDDDDDRTHCCLDASSSLLEGSFEAQEELAAVGGKSRVRDVWSPVSGVAGALEGRLNLGALAKESEEPVISAYLAGLLRDPNKSSPAAYQSRQQRPSPRPQGLFPPFHPAVAPSPPLSYRQPLPPGTPSPPSLLTATANTSSPATACSAGASTPGRFDLRRDRGAFSSGERQRGRRRRRHPRCVALSGPCEGNHGRTTAAGHPAPPATAPSGTLTASMVAKKGPNGRRANSAPEHPTAPSPQHHGWHGKGTGGSPHEDWDWCEYDYVAAVGAGAPDSSCRRQQQRVEPSGGHVGCQGEDPESFLLCRGWGAWPEKATFRPTEGDRLDSRPAAPSPLTPEGVSPGFGGECGGGFGPGHRNQQEELIPRNMFLTRTQRHGHRLLAPPG